MILTLARHQQQQRQYDLLYRSKLCFVDDNNGDGTKIPTRNTNHAIWYEDRGEGGRGGGDDTNKWVGTKEIEIEINFEYFFRRMDATSVRERSYLPA